MSFKKLLMALGCTLLATSAMAELQSAQFTPEEKSDDGIKAILGGGGGSSLLAEDGAIFASLRIGLELNSFLTTGAFASFLISDVRNYNVPFKQMVDYNAFGGFVEFTPLRIGKFSLSVPVEIGGGAVAAMENGDEAFESSDYFFMADAALHFNYRVTKMLEVSVGGGYRIFADIEENNLENSDFNTPFCELRFTIKE